MLFALMLILRSGLNVDPRPGHVLPAAGPSVLPHDGYDTLGGSCKACHDIDALRSDFPTTPEEAANRYCVTCHVPNLPLPDPSGTFLTKLTNPVANGFNPQAHYPGAGSQPPLSTRLVLNSLGSGVSVYQRDPYNPALSEHRRGLICLSCHTAHTSRHNQILTGLGAVAGGAILRASPTTNTGSVATPVDAGAAPSSLVIDNWAVQGANWCLRCHPEDSSSSAHNHPDYLCLQCHQDTGLDSPLSVSQFPHTSDKPNLLAADPDVLCVSCHKKDSMP